MSGEEPATVSLQRSIFIRSDAITLDEEEPEIIDPSPESRGLEIAEQADNMLMCFCSLYRL